MEIAIVAVPYDSVKLLIPYDNLPRTFNKKERVSFEPHCKERKKRSGIRSIKWSFAI